MVTVDERMDHLKLLQKSAWHVPATHPDLDPPHEALQLEELFREIARSPAIHDKPADFHQKLAEAQSMPSLFTTCWPAPRNRLKPPMRR